MNSRLLPHKSSARIAKSILAGSICVLLGAALAPRAAAQTWINDDSATSFWLADPLNWLGGIVGGGIDSTIEAVYFPTYNITGTVTDIATPITLDGPVTIGDLIMEDLDNFGSASISIVNDGVSQTLTFDTTTGVPPTVLVGQNLNAIAGGKKAILNTVIVAGDDGLRKTGPGYLGLRQAAGALNNHTFTGSLRVEGGLLQLASQTVYAGATHVSGGATLFMDFANANAPVINPVSVLSPLVLGSAGAGGFTRGGAVVVNSNKAAISTVMQTWSGTTLNEGTHQFRLVSNTDQNLTYSLGPVVRMPGATMDFSRSSANGTVTVNAGLPNGANGIIGGWAVFTNTGNNSFDWAINNGAGVMTALGAYSANTFGTGLHSNLVLPASVASVPGGTVTNTIKINNGHAINIGLAGTLTVESGGILVGQQSPAFTGGSIRTGAASGELLLHTYGANTGFLGANTGLRIDSQIVDNGVTPLKLIKAGIGQVTLTRNNTYTGTTYVGAGVLQLGNGWGGATTGSLGPGDVFLNGFSNSTGLYQPSGTLMFNRAGTLTVMNDISGPGSIAQAATGTLVLNKQFNIRNLQGLAGRVLLDFTAPGAPVDEIINSIETAGAGSLATASLLLRCSLLEINAEVGFHTQSFGLTTATGAGRIRLVTSDPASGITLNLGALGKFHNSNDGGGTLRIDEHGYGVRTVTAPNGGSAGQSQQLGIIVDLDTPWVTWGDTDWAAKDAVPYNAGYPLSSVEIVPGSTIPGFYTPSSGGIFAGNLDIDDSPLIAAPSVLGSMRFNGTGGVPNVVTIAAGATLQPHGILVGTGVGPADVTIAGPGTIIGTDDGGAGARDLPIIQNNLAGDLIITAPIVNFDADTRTTLVKAGNGTLVLDNGGAGVVTHTYTDRTFVNEGTLRVGAGTSIGTTATRTGSVLIRKGTVVVEDDGSINTGAFTSIGHRIGENGTLTLKDSAIYDVSAEFIVGDTSACGTLNVQDDAQLRTKRFSVGRFGFAQGVVNLSGFGMIVASNTPDTEWHLGGVSATDPTAKGTMNQSGDSEFNLGAVNFQIGRHGIGEYNLSGGIVTGTGFHVLGRFVSGVGMLSISGSSLWDAGVFFADGANYFIVGEQGTGTLTVSDGFLMAKNLSIAHNGGVGTVNFNGGIISLVNTSPIGAIPAGVVFGQTNAPATPLAGYGGTLNLNGGYLETFGIRENPGLTTPVSSVVTFDGGTVQATGNNAAFMQGLDSAIIEDGGATIATQGNITIAQPLLHDGAGPALDGGLTKFGTGTLTLTGVNTYTGGTRISEGILNVNANAALGALTGGVTISNGATLQAGGNVTSSRAFTLGTGGGKFDTGSNTIVLDGASTVTGTALTKLGTGTLTLAGANSYNGPTTVSAGTLQAGSTTAFGSNSAVTLANVVGVTLDLNGNNVSIGSLAGGGLAGGNVTLGGGTLTTGGNGTSTTFAGMISGAGGLTKMGAGTQTLTGFNTYAGTTTVNAGKLVLTQSFTTSAGIVIANGAVLELGAAAPAAAEELAALGSPELGFNAPEEPSGSSPFDPAAGSDYAAPGMADVPEPGAFGLLAFGALGLFARRRRA